MSFAIAGTVIGAGVGLYSANKQAGAARDAAGMQAQSAADANQLQREMYDQSRNDQTPWRNAGSNALTKIQEQLNGAEWSKPFDASMMQADPGYQFRLDQGQKALNRQLSAGGKYFSGGALKDMQGYTQGMASQEFGNAFNRFQTDRQNRMNPLMSMAGLGQSSASQMGQQGMQTGALMGNNLMSGASASAAGVMGAANAQTSGLNNLYGFMKQAPWKVGSGGSSGTQYDEYGAPIPGNW